MSKELKELIENSRKSFITYYHEGHLYYHISNEEIERTKMLQKPDFSLKLKNITNWAGEYYPIPKPNYVIH